MRSLTDLLHPIVVREVRCALRGRIYFATLTVACLAVLGIAMGFVQQEAEGAPASRWLLEISMLGLIPILWFVLPIQAFVSLREEVESGTADDLVLTELRPLSIVLGMVQSSLMLALMFVGVFAPLLALSYLALAADVWTLLQVVWVLLLGNVVMTSLALATIRLWRVEALRDHSNMIAMAATGGLTFFAVSRLEAGVSLLESFARSDVFALHALRQFALALLVACAFCMLAARTLTAFQENREMSRRVFGLVAAPVAAVLLGVGLDGVEKAWLWVFLFAAYQAVTEPPRFTWRQRILVPLDRSQANRMYPLLPGACRGLHYVVLLAAVLLLTGCGAHLATRGIPTGSQFLFSLVGALYLVMFASIVCRVRCRSFEASRNGSQSARARILPIGLFMVIPCLGLDVLLRNLFGINLLLLEGSEFARFRGGTPTFSLVIAFQLCVIAWSWRGLRVFRRASWDEVMALATRDPSLDGQRSTAIQL